MHRNAGSYRLCLGYRMLYFLTLAACDVLVASCSNGSLRDNDCGKRSHLEWRRWTARGRCGRGSRERWGQAVAAPPRAGPPRPPARPLLTHSTSRYLVLSKYLFLSLSLPAGTPVPERPSRHPADCGGDRPARNLLRGGSRADRLPRLQGSGGPQHTAVCSSTNNNPLLLVIKDYYVHKTI